MPSIHKSWWLAIVAGCVAGIYSPEISAQATRKTTPSNGTAQAGTPKRGSTTPGAATKPATQGNAKQAEPGKAKLEQQQARPVGQPMRIPILSPELEDILIEWEQKSSKITRLEGTFDRTTYDKTWKVVLQSRGIYCFEFPDKGAFQQTGIKIADGTKINRPDGTKQGSIYDAKPGPDERWVCDGLRIIKIEENVKQFNEIGIPPEDRGQNIRNSPLPFLFGMKANEAKQRYKFALNTKKTNDQQVWMSIYPQLPQDLSNYQKAEVILDRATCLPIAVKLYDALEPEKVRKEEVYYFPKEKMTINKRNWVQWLSGDPLKPDLRAYKKILAPADAAGAPPGTKLALPPEGRKSAAVQPASGRATIGPKTAPQRTAQLPDDEDPPDRPSSKGKARLP